MSISINDYSIEELVQVQKDCGEQRDNNMTRLERLENNFSLAYVRELNVAQIIIILKEDQEIPAQWKELPNVQAAMKQFNLDPNAHFFAKHKKLLKKNKKT